MQVFVWCFVLALGLAWANENEVTVIQCDEDPSPFPVVLSVEASPTEIPFIVSLRDEDDDHFCAATIIDPYWVVTSASCVEDLSPEDVKIHTNAYSMNSSSTAYATQRIVIHPDYDSDSLVNDLALLETTSPFVFNREVAPISVGHGFIGETQAKVAGWNLKDDGNFTNRLHIDSVRTLMNSDCRKAFVDESAAVHPVIADTMLCTVGQYCCADPGSPLVTRRLEGVLSLTPQCQNLYPDVFTRIPPYQAWISGIIRPAVE